MSRKKSQAGIVLLGILVICTIIFLQMKWNILYANFTFIYLVNSILAIISELENNINEILLKVGNIAEHSNNIGNASVNLSEHSDSTKTKVNRLVKNNENSIEKIIKTKELVDELYDKAKELQV